MEGLLFLVMAGLLAAIAMIAGLWAWRRLSRSAGLDTGTHAATIALRGAGPHRASGDDNADRNMPCSGVSARNIPDNPVGAATTVPMEPPPTGAQAADHPDHAPAERKELDEAEVREREPQPCEAELETPPPSPPPAEYAAAPAASVPTSNGQTDGAEADLQEAVGGELLPETSDLSAAAKTDGAVARGADGAADHDAASLLDLSDTAETPSDATEVATAGADNPPNERLADNLSSPDRAEAMPDVEPEAGDWGTASLLSSAVEEPASENAAIGGAEFSPESTLEPPPEPPGVGAIRSKQPAVHRDRRGKRRTVTTGGVPAEPVPAGPAPAARPPAEARLRLSLHPIRRTARLSIVLTRPDGFPERVTLQADGSHAVEAYDAQRYDDLDLPWTRELLEGELRLASTEGFRWLRSARRVHIFAADPNEPDLISVGAARQGVAHALVCRSGDAADVRSAAASAGSPGLYAHEHWQGIADGWTVLSRYTPTRAAAPLLPPDLRPLDPGAGLEILFEGGLAIRPRVYAAGHPPRITISPAPGGASITVGGESATLSAAGAWEAPGWDVPGQHMVDVVPGPSASYEIAADPWAVAGWDFWDAHSRRFENQPPRPWTRAEICGSQIRGAAGEAVFAAETQPTLIMMGLRSGAASLQRRGDVSVSMGFMVEAPAFLLAATGQRRTQGRVVWLGLTPASQASRRPDPDWVAVVRMAASRRLPLDRSDALGEDAWRKAKERARQLKRPRG